MHLANAIDALAADPRPSRALKLAGGGGAWRIRIGDHRVIYDIHDHKRIVLVVRIGHRREVIDGTNRPRHMQVQFP